MRLREVREAYTTRVYLRVYNRVYPTRVASLGCIIGYIPTMVPP